MTDPTPAGGSPAKRSQRADMRAVRRSLPDQAGRSARVCEHLRHLTQLDHVTTIMLFDAVPGEPDLSDFDAWCIKRGKRTVRPDPSPTAVHPAAPSSIDAIVVPGMAFTAGGDRLGQGGGWYDRFLSRVRPDCLRIGACFAAQVVEALPTETHDVAMHLVVTEGGIVVPRSRS